METLTGRVLTTGLAQVGGLKPARKRTKTKPPVVETPPAVEQPPKLKHACTRENARRVRQMETGRLPMAGRGLRS